MENRKSPVWRAEVPTHVRRHLTAQPHSGLTIAEYCRRHSISAWSFYQWRKRYLAKLGVEDGDNVSFKEIGFCAHGGSVCDIRFPSGITVTVRRGISRDELGGILELVAGTQSC